MNIREKVDKVEAKLDHQVGEGRCEKYREGCQARIEKMLEE